MPHITIPQEAITDPVVFAETFLIDDMGDILKPHDGQKELLRNIKKMSVICCGRQWGKSVAMAIYACWFATTHRNRQVYIIAPALDQSRIIFNEVARQFRETSLKDLVVGKIVEYPFPKIKLKNGTEIHGRGANSPQFLRGKKCHLAIVDEAAFCKDSTLTDVIEPYMTVVGKTKDAGILMISTPFGLGAFKDYYDQAVKGEDPDMMYRHFTSLDNPHADPKYLERVRKRYGDESLTWRTEYLAQFVDDDLSVFPSSHIKWAYENYPYKTKDDDGNTAIFPYPSQEGHRYVQGTDLANQIDWFVSSIFDITDKKLAVMVDMERHQKKGYAYYKSLIRGQRSKYNDSKTLIDATSLGESVVEDLRDISAEGYKFSNQSKYEIVSELARMFAEHRLAIPYNPTIISELRNFAYEYTANKNIRMEAKEGHDDIVISMALCAHLACIPTNTGFFQGVDLTRRPPKQPAPLPGYDPFAELFALD